MRQPVLRVKGPRASKVVALWTSRARRDSQASAATRLRAMLRERRPRWPETVRRQASAGEAHLQQDPFPTRLICKRGGPSARPLSPLARVSPLLACLPRPRPPPPGPPSALNAVPGVASLRRRRHTPAGRAPTMPIRAAGGRSFPKRQRDRTFAVGR